MKICGSKLLLLSLFAFGLFLIPTTAIRAESLVDVWTLDNTLNSNTNSWTMVKGGNIQWSWEEEDPFGEQSNLYSLKNVTCQGYIQYANTFLTNPTSFAVSFWVRENPNSPGENTLKEEDGQILYIKSGATTEVSWNMSANSHNRPVINGITLTDVITWPSESTWGNMPSGIWHFYVLNIGSNSAEVYMDGILKWSATYNNTKTFSTLDTIKLLDGSWYCNSNYWSDLAIYNGNLTSSDVSGIYSFNQSVKNYTFGPVITGSVYWAGVGSQYGQIGGQWSIPFFWDVCSSYENIDTLSAYLDGISGETAKVELIKDKTEFIGPQLCKGINYITGPIEKTNSATGTASIRLNTDPLGTDIVVATSSIFNYVINNGGSPDDYLAVIGENPYYIIHSSATSTLLRFSYNFTDLDYSGGSVCLYNMDSATSTAYCQSTISSVSGASGLYLPMTNNYYLDGKLILYNASSTPILESDPLIIVWYTPLGSIKKRLPCSIPAKDLSSSTDFVKGIYNIFYPSCSSLNYFQDNYDIFKHAFPFNIYFDLTNTITSAIKTASSSTSTPQSFSIPFIHKGTSSFYMLPIVASSSLNNAIGSSNASLFRIIITYIIWIFVAVIILFIIIKL